jgi:outer membrane protein OmpA-like peptidoglycan-associated protein
MDSQRDEGSVEPTRKNQPRPGNTTTGGGPAVGGSPAVGPRTKVGRYRRPLGGWLLGAIVVVPLALALLGGWLSDGKSGAATPASSTPSAPAAATIAPTVKAATPATVTPGVLPKNPVFDVSRVGDVLTITGFVPTSAAKTALLKSFETTFGSGVTLKEVVTVNKAAAPLDGDLVGKLASALKGVKGLTFDAQGTVAMITGAVASDAEKAAAVDSVKALFPNVSINADALVVGDATKVPTSCDAAASYLKLVTADTKIQFASGGSTLTAASQTALGRVAEAIKKCTTVKLLVEGNTDTSGSATKNATISKERADVVRAQLVKLGIPAANITAVGNGSGNALASNDSAAGRADNRRVDVTVQQ